MSDTKIQEWKKQILWGKAAGRCEYCNKQLFVDGFTRKEFNQAYVAHIIADKIGGPRGHLDKSAELAKDLSNLMLLCDVHHRLIDKIEIDEHTVADLLARKAAHEARIAIQTETVNAHSHVLFFCANIGAQSPTVTFSDAKEAMSPLKYPAENYPIQIGFKNSSLTDNLESFWQVEQANLQKTFRQKVVEAVADSSVTHLSIFAAAPQPLLMELGRLISDITDADVYQLAREPRTWRWRNEDDDVEFHVLPPARFDRAPALNFSLSATISEDRIEDAVGDVSIWKLTIDEPHNDFLKSRNTVKRFRETLRRLFNEIKLKHGQNSVLNIFPAMPVSLAIEVGRVWQPKADLPLRIFDQNSQCNGFSPTIEIKHKP